MITITLLSRDSNAHELVMFFSNIHLIHAIKFLNNLWHRFEVVKNHSLVYFNLTTLYIHILRLHAFKQCSVTLTFLQSHSKTRLGVNASPEWLSWSPDIHNISATQYSSLGMDSDELVKVAHSLPRHGNYKD